MNQIAHQQITLRETYTNETFRLTCREPDSLIIEIQSHTLHSDNDHDNQRPYKGLLFLLKLQETNSESTQRIVYIVRKCVVREIREMFFLRAWSALNSYWCSFLLGAGPSTHCYETNCVASAGSCTAVFTMRPNRVAAHWLSKRNISAKNSQSILIFPNIPKPLLNFIIGI